MWNATRRLGIMAGILVAFNATALADKPAEPALSPAEVGKLMLTADSWTESQMYALARHVRASMYIFIPADLGPVLYESGNPMLMLGKDYGGVFEVGDTARRGVYWNFSRESAKVRIGEGPNVTHLPSGALLIVGDIMVRDKAATRIGDVVVLLEKGRRGRPSVVTPEGATPCVRGYRRVSGRASGSGRCWRAGARRT